MYGQVPERTGVLESHASTWNVSDYDGDAMHGVSIKELQMIPALMNMHPANVLLAGDDIRITSDVMITKEAAIALNGYINDPRQFDEAEQQA